ncbi:MAG: ribosomal RNA small subunit methyltransferase A [Candidatus Micrarchaeota archaeon]|nr:ribosomal RNA small subunit methyltransferase A [Candidatus Micrarchaeota archaeon]MDE1823980.1 ribosomal RNA small subunit methyltransferase A [Candidatus Micrarchaeota archaeon]MDE1849978.1 ribosomal RNA small subunit methyltransferase A [Candidatus Micrarchaeota archaeon]
MEVLHAKKRLGQVFLVNRDIAVAEAAHASGKTVLEIGPGHGILTEELCKSASRVIAIEKDERFCRLLEGRLKAENLELVRADFMDVREEKRIRDVDIVIANIPYYLSSSVVEWLAQNRLEAVLCLQKEFVEHMLAKPDTRSYSKLSVVSSLLFRIVKIMGVKKGSFRPIPKVDSAVIYMQPKKTDITEKEMRMLGLIMQHKKKLVKNAIFDSSSALGVGRDRLADVVSRIGLKEERVFKLPPESILDVAKQLAASLE